jgi:hypothetical protein
MAEVTSELDGFHYPSPPDLQREDCYTETVSFVPLPCGQRGNTWCPLYQRCSEFSRNRLPKTIGRVISNHRIYNICKFGLSPLLIAIMSGYNSENDSRTMDETLVQVVADVTPGGLVPPHVSTQKKITVKGLAIDVQRKSDNCVSLEKLLKVVAIPKPLG